MKNLVALSLVVLLSACATGRDFVRPAGESLTLGSTTYNDVVKAYGEPRRTDALSRNGVPLKRVTYSHATATPFTTKLATRAMVLVFQNDSLVSYDYASSFEEDKVTFDREKVKQIAKGDPKSKVIAVLGKPSGEAIYPIAANKGQSQLRYSFLDTYRIPFNPVPRITRQEVTVALDANGTVSDVSTVESNPQ